MSSFCNQITFGSYDSKIIAFKKIILLIILYLFHPNESVTYELHTSPNDGPGERRRL